MSRTHSSRRVFLIGFMGAGKTSVGRVLAGRLGWKFIDLDRLIEERTGKKVAAIFADHGEAAFRNAESAALEELVQDGWPQDDLVVALGGGTFAQAANRERLQNTGAVTVLLEAPLEELRRRCSSHETVRPLAGDQSRFAELFAARQSTYSLAQHKVNTMGKAVDDVAAEIERILKAAMPEVKQ